VVVDGRYEKLRQGGQVLDTAVLTVCEIGAGGCRDVLGCSVSLSEPEVHWRTFLSTLKDHDLYGIDLVVSDAHEGLHAARQSGVRECVVATLPISSAEKCCLAARYLG